MVLSTIWGKNRRVSSKDGQNCTNPKDECNSMSLRKSRVFLGFFKLHEETHCYLLKNI